MLDSLAAARDAGYVRGLLVGTGMTLAFVFALIALSWFLGRRPDPDYVAHPKRRLTLGDRR
jgi:hypothetical protein